MNSCSFFSIKIRKSANGSAIKQTPLQGGGFMVSFYGIEKCPNGFSTYLFRAFDDVARKIINMKLDADMRVNIVSELQKFSDGGEEKYSFKIRMIDYADRKEQTPAKQPTEQKPDRDKIDLRKKDVFSQLLPEDYQLI